MHNTGQPLSAKESVSAKKGGNLFLKGEDTGKGKKRLGCFSASVKSLSLAALAVSITWL